MTIETITIPDLYGIDIQAGLKIVGGRQRSYQKILNAFFKEGLKKTDEIANCIADKNIPLYVTYVHGIKSSAANVGALHLSAMCADLEAAGNAGQWDKIVADTPDMMNEYKMVLDAMNTVLFDSNISAAAAQQPSDNAAIKKGLLDLRAALDGFDITEANKICDAFIDMPKGDFAAAIEKILHNKTVGDFDAAIEEIDALIVKI